MIRLLLIISFAVSLTTTLSAQKKQASLPDTLRSSSLEPVEITAIRAADKAPFAKTTLSREDIEKVNIGQDLPFVLNQLTGVVASSDAGNGVGYTGIRIRGTDASRINVTLNGIPFNDAESQGTFFVNLPDFVSSASSIQVQRGVGTSSNGPGAFGGTINLSTNETNDKFYAELNNSAGSFNTWKNTFRFGSGRIGKHFVVEGRLSRITSDGYVDRASSDLRAYFLSAAYLNGKNSLRLNVFSGKEVTYQAWNGIPESMLKTNRRFNPSGMDQPGRPYENETDNYRQTHYQLFYNHQFNPYWKAGAALFVTDGAGYYENYRANQRLSNFGLPNYFDGNQMISRTDLVRRLWLDNRFYGTTYSVQHQKGKTDFTVGGIWSRYNGDHFGEIPWARVTNAVPRNHRWYDFDASKSDFSIYTKLNQQIGKRWTAFADIQLRRVGYYIEGFRNNPGVSVDQNWTFLNPKFGLSYQWNGWRSFLSYARAAKEPNRDDFEVGTTQLPRAEKLNDWELGLERRTSKYTFAATAYYMAYRDQLILTGQINDVGAYTRVNIPRSYRLGLELEGRYQFNSWFTAQGNVAFSDNRIRNFVEFIDDFDNGGQIAISRGNSRLALSPGVVGNLNLVFTPVPRGSISLISKYVSRQYLDNSSLKSRSLDPFFTQDVRLEYQLDGKLFRKTTVFFQAMNVFNHLYEANGYTFSYFTGGQTVTENFFFPMAPFNVMAGINIAL
jgi:iron complex outermembrane receptor protein